MSGTSMDGVDAVLVDFSGDKPHVVATHECAIPLPLLNQLHVLADPKTGDINLLGQCDRACGELFATASNQLLALAKVDPEQVIAIGSHGQTVRHMPNLPHPFSLQIGDACTIATMTSIDTIADFRRKDIALGGQGAPLVPAFHQQLFSHQAFGRVILNIGGISNITWLSGHKDETKGFDTGPGNTLLDAWFVQHNHGTYDESGNWAATGKVDSELLNKFLHHPYFQAPAPKSTGRELFNMAWLQQHLDHFPHLTPQDIQATLSQLTAVSIANEIKQLRCVDEIYICGGGIFNRDLITRIQTLLPAITIGSTQELGLAPQWVEAIAFAWLAYCFIEKKTSNLPLVTGATRAAILGAFYPAN